MISAEPSKVMASHLARQAYLYVRQSTLRQVIENQESTRRQYALRQRAIALGWSSDDIVVIDKDLGQSGASAVDREGFQELVSAVSLGRAGIVLGLEVSRLARNSTDWHRLLEICALTETLILDEDGIYDPAHFNDRLLLGLKGTMSEAELHVLRSRLRGGILNAARRGALRWGLPIGFVRDEAGRAVLDPDQQVQHAIRLLFETFGRLGTACSTVKHFNQQGLLFPKRLGNGPRRGEVLWDRLGLQRTVSILHNPCYAGAYVYGRKRSRKLPSGRTAHSKVARDAWIVFLRDAHPGYISWDEHERIEQQLRRSAQAYGIDRRGPPREGPALLQGLAVCGVCGIRMSVRYHYRRTGTVPDYTCFIHTIEHREPPCQIIPGAAIDEAISKLLVERMTPMALEVTLAVQTEIQHRLDDADQLRSQQVERAEYEGNLARRRFMQVDPDNRLVADALEAEWNQKLRATESARQDCETQRERDRTLLDELQCQRIRALAEDFPAIWNDPATPHRERKRMAALLLEDVTLIRGDQIIAHVRFRGGATTTLTLPRPLQHWQHRQTPKPVIEQIDALLEDHTDGQAATILNEQGVSTGTGGRFDGHAIDWVRRRWGLKSLRERLRDKGMMSVAEMARHLGMREWEVRDLRTCGRLQGRTVNEKGEWMLEPPAEDVASSLRRTKATARPSRNASRTANASTRRGAV